MDGAEVAFDDVGLPIDELVIFEGPWYARKPPFDCVLIERGDEVFVFALDQLRFDLARLDQLSD
jgi:hypothetical protein